MPTDERMTINERRKYLKVMRPRYQKAGRKEKQHLLTEMEAVTGLHRKSLVRLLRHPDVLERKPRKRQRGRKYDHHLDDALRVIAETLDYVCAERLQPVLVATAERLAQHGELDLTPAVRDPLAAVSISTVRRRWARLLQDVPKLPRKRPSRGRSLTRDIPMGRIPWDEATPGHFETDLVHHGGDMTVGEYVHTLQMVDVATGWSERVAVFGRSERAMKGGSRQIERRVPFEIREIHPDNGTEFFNQHLLRYFRDKVPGAHLSRSRPYQNNDNRIVEQKNDTLVRAFFGSARFDTLEHLRLLNRLYDKMWLYYNFFQPVLHLIEKERVDDGQGRVRFRRKWDHAQTPFDRVCAAQILDEAIHARLTALRDRTNPRQLRREIYPLRAQGLDLPLATGIPDVIAGVSHADAEREAILFP